MEEISFAAQIIVILFVCFVYGWIVNFTASALPFRKKVVLRKQMKKSCFQFSKKVGNVIHFVRYEYLGTEKVFAVSTRQFNCENRKYSKKDMWMIKDRQYELDYDHHFTIHVCNKLAMIGDHLQLHLFLQNYKVDPLHRLRISRNLFENGIWKWLQANDSHAKMVVSSIEKNSPVYIRPFAQIGDIKHAVYDSLKQMFIIGYLSQVTEIKIQ
jgi:hypothetical protein